MLLMVLGLMLFIAGASQTWQPVKLHTQEIAQQRQRMAPPMNGANDDDETQWVKRTYAANMMRAGALLSACGVTFTLISY